MSGRRQSRVARLRNGQLAAIDTLYATVTDPAGETGQTDLVRRVAADLALRSGSSAF